jgi:hypothetical protein
MDYSERKEKLMKASDKLKDASKLIEDALNMSGMNCRGEEILKIIDYYTSVGDNPCSIPNILMDLESADEDPCWTRPFASVKQFDRKDI